MTMEIDDQKDTYSGFIRYTVRSVVAIVVVLVLMAAFLA